MKKTGSKPYQKRKSISDGKIKRNSFRTKWNKPAGGNEQDTNEQKICIDKKNKISPLRGHHCLIKQNRKKMTNHEIINGKLRKRELRL